jgi:hypothetical protein
VGSSSTTVGRTREQSRQQQAIALAAGQHADRRIGAAGVEQEILQVARDVFAILADLHPVGAGAHCLGDGEFGIKLVAKLIEIGHLQIRATFHAPRVRLERADDQLDHGGWRR